MNNGHGVATDAVAAAAAVSPIWLPWLREVSEIAGLVVPILGAFWLLLQIVLRIRATLKKIPDHSDTGVP